MFSSILQSRGSVELDPYARPIVIVENPETSLTPYYAFCGMGIIEISFLCNALRQPIQGSYSP